MEALEGMIALQRGAGKSGRGLWLSDHHLRRRSMKPAFPCDQPNRGFTLDATAPAACVECDA